MKLTKEQIEDQLMDALLHEQNRHDNQQAWQQIEAALDQSAIAAPVKKTVPWRRRIAQLAAALVVGSAGVVAYHMQQKKSENTLVYYDRVNSAEYHEMQERSVSLSSPTREKYVPVAPPTPSAGISRHYDSLLESEVTDESRNARTRTISPPVASEPPSIEIPKPARTPVVDLHKHVLGHTRAETTTTERYSAAVDPTWKNPTEYPLSTFSIDVDNASYSNIRRIIRDGQAIPPDAVRLEECINAFDYNYAPPEGDKAFAVHTTVATCPWNEKNYLLKVGLKGKEMLPNQRPASNLVFLIDVSGSMQDPRKLPLVKESLTLLLNQLDERDSVSYVVYAGSEGVVLPPTKMTEEGREKALSALKNLEAGGSTNGGAGITRAYQLALENFVSGGANRVILASDGDFNVGITNQQELVSLVKERAAKNIYLSVLSFGTGNLNDSLMEAISKDGNGNYYYIDSIREGRKVFLQRLSGTLVTIAKDVKMQIEFNPQKVASYRLIGYANRVLKDEDFANDKVDAGDIGAGHTVTAFYEIVGAEEAQLSTNESGLKYQKPVAQPRVEAPAGVLSEEWMTLKLRYKQPEGDVSALEEVVVKGAAKPWQESGNDFVFASTVALFGMKLRGMEEVQQFSWSQLREFASPVVLRDPQENRTEFLELLQTLERKGN